MTKLASTRANKYRNYLCPCQSGKKYKNCHYAKDQQFINEDENKREDVSDTDA